jgi:hypothetical protein
MKAAKITIRVIVLFLTSVWGVFFGLIGPVIIMGGDIIVSDTGGSYVDVSGHFVIRLWVAATIAGYFVPCFLMMLNRTKAAACFALLGTVLTLYIHTILGTMTEASFMYMPQIFMTILAVIYIFVINPHYITGRIDRRSERLNAPAPSILGSRDDIRSPAKKESGK